MKAILRNAIRQECNKLIERHFEYLYELEQDAGRIEKRTGARPLKEIRTPSYWSANPNFNPFKTRLSKPVEMMSYTLAEKIKRQVYRPRTALIHPVQKADGTMRDTYIFQIPDAVVSRVVYKSLLKKNQHRLSSYAYAYREDVGVHEAVANISADWLGKKRIYVAEFDFSKFFSNISHEYLEYALEKGSFLYTPNELHVVEQFLKARALHKNEYSSDGGISPDKGIPQGTSISLFLANVACWELDRDLERSGVGFARYADDTLIWSESYEKVVGAYELLDRFSARVGAPLNLEKSKGINLLTNTPLAEIAYKSEVVFLGYALSLSQIKIAPRHIQKIKEHISKLIYCNLLQMPKSGRFNPDRLTSVDLDYNTLLLQLRRYLYGGLTEEKLFMYIRGAVPHLNFRGLMSYYPVVNDQEQLGYLDAWLRRCLRLALRRRQRIIAALGGPAVLPGPYVKWIDEVGALKMVPYGGHYLDFRVPSFSLIHKGLRLALERSGTGAFGSTKAAYY